MNALRNIIRIKNILMKHTLETRYGWLHYGTYPHIAIAGDKISQMPWSDTLRNWFIPLGIPYTVVTGDNMALSKKYIAYKIGDEMFVHDKMFRKFVDSENSSILSVPVREDTTSLARKGWLKDENEMYENLLWRLALRTSGTDFQCLSRVTFAEQSAINADVLSRDGWVVNKAIGNNVYYGMIVAKTRMPDSDTVYWYNKYIVLLDLSRGGSGMMIDGLMKWESNPHPHVHPNLRLCFGKYEAPLHEHANKGEITKYFLLMSHFLGQYNPDSPTFHLPLNRSNRGRLSGRAAEYFSNFIHFRG